MGVRLDHGLCAFRMERARKAVGERAASVYRNRRRGSQQARDRAMGMLLEGVRSRVEWSRTRFRQHPNSPAGCAGPHVQSARPFGRTSAAALWILPRRAHLWHAAAWRNRAGRRSHRDAAGWREIDPRGDCVSQDDRRAGSDGRFAIECRCRSTRQSRYCNQDAKSGRRGFVTVLMILIALGATAGVFLLTRMMNGLSLRAQFGVLLGLGV